MNSAIRFMVCEEAGAFSCRADCEQIETIRYEDRCFDMQTLENNKRQLKPNKLLRNDTES